MEISSSERLLKTVDSLTKEQLQGTNLEIIQAYFSDMNSEEYDVVTSLTGSTAILLQIMIL